MNTLILTFQLLEPYSKAKHPGIDRLFSSCKMARIGDNAFLVRTKLEPDEICEQLQHHLVRGEFLCVFTAELPAQWIVPEFIGKQMDEVLNDETESGYIIPPVEL